MAIGTETDSRREKTQKIASTALWVGVETSYAGPQLFLRDADLRRSEHFPSQEACIAHGSSWADRFRIAEQSTTKLVIRSGVVRDTRDTSFVVETILRKTRGGRNKDVFSGGHSPS